MSVTLAQLKNRSRVRADMEDTEFITDSELTEYINSSIAELHDILVQSYGEDYYVKSVTFTTAANVDQYELSSIVTDADFYKLRGLDAQLSGSEWTTLTRFNFNERNRYDGRGSWNGLGLLDIRYRLVGSTIMFSPVPDSSVNLNLWYVPKAVSLVDDTDTYDDINYYSEFIAVSAAIKMLDKEESDSRHLSSEKKNLKKRIEESSSNRDIENSDSVQDVYAQDNPYWYGRY